jgi:cell division inhibitor SulA
LTTLAVRGWGRGSTGELLTELQQSLTPTLNQYAGDARHLELVRPSVQLQIEWQAGVNAMRIIET